MFFEPLTSWIVALFADGIVVSNERAKSKNVTVHKPEPKPSWYQEPHRDPKDGKIIIENSQLYHEDVRNYGAYQAQQWVKQGKYNLTPEELEKERARIKAKYEAMQKLL